MLKRGSFFLFALERYDRQTQSIRTIGGVIIAAESPALYVGRLLVGADHVEDKSDLTNATLIEQRILAELERLVPGTKITREYEELLNLFSDEQMDTLDTTVTFSRKG